MTTLPTLTAAINKIIPFSIVDGPGSRTSIFLQSCNFNCGFCHNPETIKMCCHCGDCVPGCPTSAIYINEFNKVIFEAEKCILCDQCINICKHLSSPRILNWTAVQTIDEIKKQLPFIQGITVSGGECTLNPHWLTQLFAEAKKLGLNCFIDSNGSFPFSKHPLLLQYTDAVMLDLKAGTSEEFLKVCSHKMGNFYEEAALLASLGKLYELRTVIIPKLFNVEKCVLLGSQLLAQYQNFNKINKSFQFVKANKNPYIPRYKLITYRSNGVRTEFAQNYKSPDFTLMQKLKQIAIDNGVKEVIIV